MRKIRNMVVGTAIAGALAAGLAAAPAAQAATASKAAPAAQAASPRHFFGPFYSRFGGGEHRDERSYFKGYWYKKSGRYFFFGDLFDRDHDREYSYVWMRWHDDRGFHEKVFRTFDHFHYANSFTRSSGFDRFFIRVAEGDSKFDDASRFYRVF